jgi:hypothetical protein
MYHAVNFAGEQKSLQALVVKLESSEKGFPFLLGTQLLGRDVGVENFHSICKRGPEILKSVIEDVFKCVTVVLIQRHPGIFFNVIDHNVCLGYKRAGEGAARQNPTKLDAEDQEETVNMAGKVFIQLDTASFKCCIIRWKVRLAPGEMTVVITVDSVVCLTAESITSSQSVILVVRHVVAALSKTWKIDAGPPALAGDLSVKAVTRTLMSAQIKRVVSVHQVTVSGGRVRMWSDASCIMRFLFEHVFFFHTCIFGKKLNVQGKITCKQQHAIFSEHAIFSKHACSKKNRMFGKFLHVDMKFLHVNVNMRFFPKMNFRKKLT